MVDYWLYKFCPCWANARAHHPSLRIWIPLSVYSEARKSRKQLGGKSSVKKDALVSASACQRLLQMSEGHLQGGRAYPLKVRLDPQGPWTSPDSEGFFGASMDITSWSELSGTMCCPLWKKSLPSTCVWDGLRIQSKWIMGNHDFQVLSLRCS